MLRIFWVNLKVTIQDNICILQLLIDSFVTSLQERSRVNGSVLYAVRYLFSSTPFIAWIDTPIASATCFWVMPWERSNRN